MKYLFLVIALLIGSFTMAQTPNGGYTSPPFSSISSGVGAPSGSCNATQVYINQSNGNIYTCSGGSWVLSGGGGTGTVTAVTGNAPITSSGGNTPAIGCATCTTNAVALANGDVVNGAGGNATQDSGIASSTLVTSAAALTINVIPKGNGTQGLVASSCTDNGTNVTCTEPLISGGTIAAATSGQIGINGLSGFRSAANGRANINNNTNGSGGLTRMTFGSEATGNPAFCISASAQFVTCDGAGTTANGSFKSAAYAVTNLLMNATAPTIAAAGCGGSGASISANNGTAAFNINVGTGPTSTGCTITMPAATTGWNCNVNDMTSLSTTIFVQKQTGAISTTSVTFQNFGDVATAQAPNANDIYHVTCSAY